MSVASRVQSPRASVPQPVAGLLRAPTGVPGVGPARSGHSLALIRTAAPDGPAQVIQPLLTRDAFRSQGGRASQWTSPLRAAWRLVQPRQLTDIDNLIHQYHQHAANDANEGSVHTRLALLDQIEHHAYSWFDQNRDTDPTHATHRSLRALLDTVQADHEALIGATDQHNHQLWTPDRANALPGALNQVDADWDSLRGGHGSIHIHDSPLEDGTLHEPGFRARTLSSFARLLSRQHGRSLVHDLDTSVHPVDLHPMHPYEYADKPYNAVALHQGGGAFAVPDPMQALGYQVGGGSGSSVRYDPRHTDSASADLDYLGRKVYSPAFITLGHELIHARHNQEGSSRKNVEPGRYLAGGDRVGWGDREEYDTIAHGPGVTENLLRGEHGLSARHGHDGGRAWEDPPRT